jgi:hypothetical protein
MVSRNLKRSTCSGLCIPLVFPVPHKTAFEATLSRLDASPPPHMSETVVLYPLTMVIQLVIVCLSCDFGLLILDVLTNVTTWLYGLTLLFL